MEKGAMSSAVAGALTQAGGDNPAKSAQVEPRVQWDKLTAEQKLERVRESLLTLTRQQMVIGRVAVDAKSIVLTHEHHERLGLMKPANADVAAAMGEQHYLDGPMKHVLGLLT